MKTLEKWYALSVHSGNEEATKKRITERLKKAEKNIPGLEIVCPDQEVVVKTKHGEEKRKRKMTMPGYMLIRCRRLDEVSINLISQVKGVIEFMGGNNNPTQLPQDQVDQILNEVGLNATASNKSFFESGDEIIISTGPLQGFGGQVESVDMNRRIASIDVEIFGQTTKTQIDLDQIKKA
jgi:transcriptional antiterminator NusG